MSYLSFTGENVKTLSPGMYLGLYHGFQSEEERVAADGEWGQDGPIIGPLKSSHTTYKNIVRLEFATPEDAARYPELTFFDSNHPRRMMARIDIDANDCLPFGDYQYGDWSFFMVPTP